MYKLSIVAFVLGLFLLGTTITMKALPSAEASCNTSVNCDTFCVETEYCGLEAVWKQSALTSQLTAGSS